MSEKIMKYFHMENYIEASEKDIISYGIEQSIMFLFSIMATTLLGGFLGVLEESIIFLIFFVPLRMYAGGYHADSRKKCGVLSLCIILICLCFIKNATFLNSNLCLLISTVSTIFIWFMAPVENSNRKLSEQEKIYFRKKTRTITSFVYIVFIVAIVFHSSTISKIVTISLALVYLSLLFGKIEKIRCNKKARSIG